MGKNRRKVMKIRKTVRYMRHSDRVWQIIGPAGLDRAQREAPKGDYTDIFHSQLIRTAQTALAIVASLGIKARVHAPIDELGKDTMFDYLVTEEFKAACEAGQTSFEAFYSTTSPENIANLEELIMSGLKTVFMRINDGGFALVIGHEPFISICAKIAGQQNARELGTLEYIDFVLDDDGNITVA
jgi:hypothetical protein